MTLRIVEVTMHFKDEKSSVKLVIPLTIIDDRPTCIEAVGTVETILHGIAVGGMMRNQLRGITLSPEEKEDAIPAIIHDLDKMMSRLHDDEELFKASNTKDQSILRVLSKEQNNLQIAKETFLTKYP
jgi:hypothetical protein